jgi:hypothetical protein
MKEALRFKMKMETKMLVKVLELERIIVAVVYPIAMIWLMGVRVPLSSL